MPANQPHSPAARCLSSPRLRLVGTSGTKLSRGGERRSRGRKEVILISSGMDAYFPLSLPSAQQPALKSGPSNSTAHPITCSSRVLHLESHFRALCTDYDLNGGIAGTYVYWLE
jgi:hypothetical protein